MVTNQLRFQSCLKSVGFWLLVFLIAGALTGHSSFAAREVLVRFHAPQDSAMQLERTQELASELGAKSVQVLQGPEGLVKLEFDHHQASLHAQKELESHPWVESLSKNHWYRPALHLQAREVEDPSEKSESAFRQPLPNYPDLIFPSAPPSFGLDPYEAHDWAMSSIRMPAFSQALDAAATSVSSIITAVMDTGIDYNHEDLMGALWHHPDRPSEVGYDFAHGTNRPYDVLHFDMEGCMKDSRCRAGVDEEKFMSNPGHGTHCAGHVGAVANNRLGMRGVSSNRARIMGLKFFFDRGEENAGQGDDVAAIQSIDYAIRNGVKIISASWGGRQTQVEAEHSELKKALVRAQRAGILIVVAAGNEGIDQDAEYEPVYPAKYDLDNLIVVAAVDSKDRLADFSNYGANSVHLGAPGVKILSTTVGGGYNDQVVVYKNRRGVVQEMDWDGTSMATPIVAGAAALIWSKHPNETYLQIKNRILASVRHVPSLDGKLITGGVLDLSSVE